jgi:hypothetical protein
MGEEMNVKVYPFLEGPIYKGSNPLPWDWHCGRIENMVMHGHGTLRDSVRVPPLDRNAPEYYVPLPTNPKPELEQFIEELRKAGIRVAQR